MQRFRLALVLMLIAIPVVGIAGVALAVTPLALPAYELVNFNAGEIQNVGFSGGRA